MMTYDTTNKQLLVYSNGKWQADRTTAIIVAASNSSDADKAAADYVATGTGDQATINSALTAANPAGAGRKTGRVVLLAGTYTISAAISVPNNTTLAGVGVGTIVTVPNAQNGSYTMVSAGTGATVRDLKVDGNGTNQTSGGMRGIDVANSSLVTHITVGNLYGGLGSFGIYIVGNYNVISDSTVQNSGGQGVYDFSSGQNTISGNIVVGNDRGIVIAASSDIISNNIVRNNARGITISTYSGNVVSGNTIEGNTTYGIHLVSGASKNTISQNSINDNGNTTDNNGIYLNAADSNTIIGNTITDTSCTATCRAINISDAGSDNNYLADNVYTGDGTFAATINDAGTGTRYAGQSFAQGGLDMRFKQTNSTTAFSIQNANGVNLMNVDTTNGEVEIGSYNGGTNPVAGKIVIANSTNANTVTIRSAAQTSGSYSLTIPNLTANATICTSNNNCTGLGAYIQNGTSLQTSANFNIQSAATGSVTAVIRQLGSQTADLLQFQNNGGTPVLKVNTDGNLLAGSVATATTGTTEATARTNVTSITLTTDAFNVNDVIFFNNAGQDYYTRITVDNANGTYTVSPAVSYDASVTVTKYTIQNVGATATDYSTQSNRFFQGYFTGGVVAGAGSTVYSDGVISASPGLTVKNPTNTTTAFQVQDASGNNMMLTDTVNSIIKTGSYAGTSVIEEDLMTTMTGTLTGVATHVSGQYVELTHNVQGTDGQVDYTLSASSDFDTSFDFQTVGTADSVYMYAYTNSVPTEQSVAAGGYVVGFDEWTDSIKLFFNGTQLTSAAQGGMENGSWHSVSISKVGTNIKVYINSTLVIDYTDVQRTLSGTHFGLGGRSGGLTAYHRVKNFFFSASTTPGTNKSISTQVYGSSGVRSITNSTTAFLVQTAAGTNVLSVNTTSGTVQIGNTSDTLYNLLVLDNNNQSSDPACTNGGMYYNSSTHKFRGCQNGSWVNMAFGIDVQTYTMAGSSSWTKPSGVSTVMVILCGAGGGGGGGSTSLKSGSGGGGGAHVERFFLASDLTSTVTVTVGTGGSGGPAGSSGGFGSASSFGSYAYAGGGGVGTSGVKGGGGGGGVTSTTNDLGAENPTAGANGIGWQGASGGAVALNGGNSQHGGGGGGGARTNSSQTGMGGGSSAAGGTGGGSGGVSNGFAGGAGGKTGSWTAGGGAAGGTNAAGTAGSAATSTHCGTGGGGGGGSSTTGWAGGAGGAGGGGGGGGGAGTTAGGSGGNGADGRVWVISW